MSIFGKIVGGVGGFIIGGPLGAVLGAAAGHAYDKMREEGQEVYGPSEGVKVGSAFERANDAARQMAFTVAVVALSAKMAKADGVVTREEISAFKRAFRIPPQDMAAVGRIFDEAKKSPDGYEAYARQIARMFADSPQILEELLGALFVIAQADGRLHPSEIAFLHKVADLFGLPPRDFDRVRATHSSSEPDPYEVLGVTREMDDGAIRSAYLKLVRENHPDTLVAQGMPPDFVDLANKKMATINAAYETLTKARTGR
ncbi:molecular chaperone DjlA [Rhodospirillum rubrum]|uniref:TerB family tellurite resistance protein n=1 Tax=Rhodospirillum rubrum TaxID=1085 RepID=UPI0019079B47|nr:TerB family tellurite resistance protein [Rhodospirillum rubrum]MBK1663964.1 molecular chaperone DjlA [Rhodospirillum rubrum]MBK1678419.1 molecular chaperone DjlA [Rhodospirillum rubrum]